MSRDLVAANIDIFYRSNFSQLLPISAPLTIAGWGRPDSITISGGVYTVGHTGTNNERYTVNFQGSVAGDPVTMRAVSTAGGNLAAESTSGYSAGVWQHACGVVRGNGTDEVEAYLDGGSKGTATQATLPTITSPKANVASANLGDTRFDGHLSDIAAWSTGLSEAEVASLAKGLCPLLCNPEKLEMYWLPFFRDPTGTLASYVHLNSPPLTENGTIATGTTNPPVHYPHPIQVGVPGQAAAAGKPHYYYAQS